MEGVDFLNIDLVVDFLYIFSYIEVTLTVTGDHVENIVFLRVHYISVIDFTNFYAK